MTTFLYDDFGALTNETVVGVAGTNIIERYYDNLGRNAGYVLNGVRQSTLACDPVTGRLLTMLANGSDTPFTWFYLPSSDLKSSLAYPNGLTASWTYDANNQLLKVCNATPTNIISQYEYTYDDVGRRVNVSKTGTAFVQNDSVDYGYNNRSELTNAVATVDTNYRYAYDFDDIGNREASFEGGTNSVYTANQLNQYTMVGRVVPNAPQDEFIPQFDDDGNQTLIKSATGIWQVTYNGENRPVLWTCGTTNITMSFDRMGRRVTKNNQRFVYDGYLQIADNGGNVYIWDPTEKVATRPLVWNCEVSAAYYVHDGNKNVSEVVESNGDVVAHYEYTPFGAINNSLNSLYHDSPWRFSSEYAEDDLALVCYNYRFYDPNIGVWLCRDPYKEEESTFFVDNNPIGAFDWLGLTTEHSSCISISHSKNFDFRNKPLGRIGLFKFTGTLASGYSLKGEACLKCCMKGANAGIKKLSGSGEVSLSGTGDLTATFGVDFKSNLFWDFYRLYLFGGVQVSVSLSGSGTGSFEFDGCDGTGTLNASLSDSIELAIRGGVEGYLKRRGGRRNGNWHYNTVAKVAALIKGSVSSSLSTTLSCDTEKCVLTSSIGGFDANIGAEFTFKRKTLSLDIWRFHGDGVVLAETEFESPLKGWAEQ